MLQMPEATTEGVLQKRCFFNMSQNSEEAPVPEQTPMNFAKFLRTTFSKNASGQLLLKLRHCNNEVRDLL